MSENIKEDRFEELPLFEIEQRWGSTEGGKPDPQRKAYIMLR